MNLLLQRNFGSPTCTMGKLNIADVELRTLERPWVPSPVAKGGTKGISCVPPGIYKLVQHSTEAHPKTWALVNPDLGVEHWDDPKRPLIRTVVLIHVANYPAELRGCIAPGMSGASCQVNHSGDAMRWLQDHVPWDNSHTLEIRGAA